MPAPKIKTHLRKEQIILAALQVIGEEGFSGLSIGLIARRVGLVPSGLYRHFRDKDAVLDGIIDLIQARLRRNVEQAMAASPEPLIQLRTLLEQHLRFIREHGQIPRVVFSEEFYAGHDGRRRRMHEMIRAYLNRIETVVRAGQQHGSIRSELDPSPVALLFLGMIQPAAMLRNLNAGDLDLDAHARTVWPIFEQALRPGAAAEPVKATKKRS